MVSTLAIHTTVLDWYSPVIQASLEAFNNILGPDALLILLFATVFGMFFGSLPGFGGFLALALILPLTFQLSPTNGFLALAATLGGTAFGGSLPAITLNIPGLPSNIATCWDGNQMAQNNQTDRAIGISALSSFSGAVIGLLLLTSLIPIVREIVLLFGAPELFTAALVGLFVIGFAGKQKPIKGTIMLLFGLSLAFVGLHTVSYVERFTFGIPYLIGGISVVPVAVGLYAIGESGKLVWHMETVAESIAPKEQSSVSEGFTDVIHHRWMVIQSAMVGWFIGLIPGVGGSLSNVLAYSIGQNTSARSDLWGTGIPEGVIAPEASNDAKDGGAIIPTVAFGIPGSGAQVFFLAGMTLNGLFPGADMLVDNLHITMTIIFGLFASNLLTSLLGIGLSKQFRKITLLPTTPLAGVIILISLLGTFTIQSNLYDVYLTIIFGALGYVMWRYSYPRILVVIAVVLGPLIDRTFAQSIQIYGPDFILRPIPILIIILFLLGLVSIYSQKSIISLMRNP